MPSDKKSSSSSSSSSSSDESQASRAPEEPAEEAEPETVLCNGDSSENEEEREVLPSHRCWNLMWTFSTPREYLADPAVRKKRKECIPDDFTREEMAEMFRDAVKRVGQLQNLREFIVVMEPHQKWKPDRSAPEMHFHIVFKMKANFAHLSIAKALATHHGCKGHMSYPAKGWAGMVRYVLQDSGVKLGCHLDQNPLFWPNADNTMTKQKMLQKVGVEDAKDATTKKEDWKEKGKRKRQLDFAQFTDWVVANNITNEAEFWKLAGKEKEEHDNPSLWNYGGQICVAKMVVKAQKGHLAAIRPEVFQFASRSDSPFPLTDFCIPPAVAEWMEKDSKIKSLIIQGTGGLGKTQMAKAILSSFGKYFFVDSLDTIKHLFFVDGEALLCDDVTLSDYTIDQVKSLLDISCDRAIRCRHEDGMVPAGTIRIFLTNHQKLFFFPTGFQMSEHCNAIERRMTWVEVHTVLFKNPPIPVLDAVRGSDLPQTSGLQPMSKACSRVPASPSSAAPKFNTEASEAESMPGDSECERELQASLRQEQDEEAALLRSVYEEPIQKVAAKEPAGSQGKGDVKDIAPFDLDVSLAEAVLLQAAERAEAKASLGQSSSEAALPIKTTSPEESPRQPRVLHRKPAPAESSKTLASATCDLSPSEPHAPKREPQKGEESLPQPWTPEGSPPPSESDAFEGAACHVDPEPLESKKLIASQTEPRAQAAAPHQPRRLEAQQVQSTTPKRTKPTDKHGDHIPAPPSKHDLNTGIHVADLEVPLACPDFSSPPLPPDRTDMPCIMADPLRRRSVALGSSHRTSQSPPWRRDRYRTRSPRWGSSHKVQRVGASEK